MPVKLRRKDIERIESGYNSIIIGITTLNVEGVVSDGTRDKIVDAFDNLVKELKAYVDKEGYA